jgi:hypothetical protein
MTSNTDNVEQVQQNLAEIRRAHKEAAREERARWLRRIGYVTRTLTFLVAIGAWFLMAYALRDPSWETLFDRPLGHTQRDRS